MRKTFCGTPEYMPPEIANLLRRKVPYDVRYVDAWSLGILAHEMFAGWTPFCISSVTWNSLKERTTFKKRGDAIASIVADFQRWSGFVDNRRALWPGYESFIDNCLQRDPQDRVSLADVLNHPFLQRSCDLDGKQTNPVTPSSNRPTSAQANSPGRSTRALPKGHNRSKQSLAPSPKKLRVSSVGY